MFTEVLDVDEVIAHLLVTEGFSAVEEVAFVPIEDLAVIEGFDEAVATELRDRARSYITGQNERLTTQRKELGVTDEVAALEGLNPAILVQLGEKDVKTIDDLADLASDELRDIVGHAKLSASDADTIIMAARAHWFEGEEAPSEETADETTEDAKLAEEEKT